MLSLSGKTFWLIYMTTQLSWAGQLRDFERTASQPAPNRSYSEEESDDDFWSSFFFGCLFGGRSSDSISENGSTEKMLANPKIVTSVAVAGETETGPEITQHEIELEESDGNEDFQHRNGTVGLPYIRFDYRWQYLEHNLDAQDYLLEAGYKYGAFYGRSTYYEDAANYESLKIDQYYGMLRYGGSDDFFFPGSFQIGAGLGGYRIRGEQDLSGAAFTIPVSFSPYDFLGFELRPAWASINQRTVSDYDLSMSLGYLYLQARIGYRWLWLQGEGHWLNGPYVGVSLLF